MGEPACFNLPVGEAVQVYLGLGTNIGDRALNLSEAVRRIGEIVRLERGSSLYQTEPVGFTEQDDFWNMVVSAFTELPARELMQRLLEVERAMGRERTIPNGPRIIDIDLLLYDDVVMADDVVEVPHPRMQERAFVLRPLLEIAPTAVHPATREPFGDVLRRGSFERAEIIAAPLIEGVTP